MVMAPLLSAAAVIVAVGLLLVKLVPRTNRPAVTLTRPPAPPAVGALVSIDAKATSAPTLVACSVTLPLLLEPVVSRFPAAIEPTPLAIEIDPPFPLPPNVPPLVKRSPTAILPVADSVMAPPFWVPAVLMALLITRAPPAVILTDPPL